MRARSQEYYLEHFLVLKVFLEIHKIYREREKNYLNYLNFIYKIYEKNDDFFFKFKKQGREKVFKNLQRGRRTKNDWEPPVYKLHAIFEGKHTGNRILVPVINTPAINRNDPVR